MKRTKIIYIVLAAVLLVIVFISMYVMNIYEVVIEVTPEELFADSQSTVLIEAYPINAFGKKIPFRTVKTNFEITSGNELVEIILLDIENGKMILKSKNKMGTITVIVKPEKALLPSEIIIPVHSNVAIK